MVFVQERGERHIGLSMTRVKICGITNIDDALAAIEAGADALGFVFAESPRKVTVPAVLNILEKIPPLVTTVGVFAKQDTDEVFKIWKQTNLHFAQLHGYGPLKEPRWHRIIKAVRATSWEDICAQLGDRSGVFSAAILLDAHVEGKMGGTGRTFDWDLAIQAKSLGKPIILAGGLTPENVAEAVRKVQPYAVDVSSGVESSPGRKDHDKIREFIANVRNA